MERWSLAFMRLDDREHIAWLKLLYAYVVNDGVLAESELPTITKTGKRWPELRDKLVRLGLGEVVDACWVDADQDKNLSLQRKYHERAAYAAQVRWERRRRAGGGDA